MSTIGTLNWEISESTFLSFARKAIKYQELKYRPELNGCGAAVRHGKPTIDHL